MGVGASAGGLKPLGEVLAALNCAFSLPILVVQHLLPTQKSHLHELLSRTTELPVDVAKDGAEFRAGCIFVAPADRHLSIDRAGHIHLDQSARVHFSRPSIDVMFQSLAARFQEQAIGILLSGSAHDGTVGMQAMHQAGALTIAQQPDTAQFRSMPDSAIQAGVVDLVLRPSEIGEMLNSLCAGMAHANG